MFILKQLMEERGYTSYIKTERDKTIPSIRKSTFKRGYLKSAKEVVITIDERKLEGISNKNKIITIYDDMIDKSLKENI